MRKIKTNEKLKRKLYSKQTGITLIALIVIIVILLILVGVSINVLFGDNGIQINETTGGNTTGGDNGIQVNGTTGENTTEGDTNLKKYKDASKNTDGTLKENAEYTDSENATVTIPKGFKVSDVAKTGDTDGEQTVSTGLVIRDADENEFVWVPVNYTATGTLDDDGLDTGFKDTFKRSKTNTNFTEPYASGYDGEDTDYLNMMKSVQANKGFYIGRYEAGTTEPRTDSTTTTSDVVVKRDAYPYIYVGWGDAMNTVGNVGAVYLSKHMYDNKDIGATSTLCYGVQWDAAMAFVKDNTHSITDSTSWGNYKNNAWSINRTTASFATSASSGSWTKIDSSEKSKTNSETFLLTTGASDTFKAKNIFDLAGNVNEWTMEANDSTDRVIRGGNCSSSGSGLPASSCNYSFPTTHVGLIGFRSALYL